VWECSKGQTDRQADRHTKTDTDSRDHYTFCVVYDLHKIYILSPQHPDYVVNSRFACNWGSAGGPGLAIHPWFSFSTCSRREPLVAQVSYRPDALPVTQPQCWSTQRSKHWCQKSSNGRTLSSSTTGLLTEEALLPSCLPPTPTFLWHHDKR